MRGTRIVGAGFVLLGAVALVEARRLAALREEMVAGAMVGDDTFPLIVGASLLLLGGYTLFLARLPSVAVSFPRGSERRGLLAAAGVLIAYTAVVPYLGYMVSTWLASMALFRAMGAYRWVACLFLSVAVVGTLYLMFRVWLLQPLPTGWLGI